MLTGLNSSTAEKLQLGAGIISKAKIETGVVIDDDWKQANVLTATNGGITVSLVPEFYTPSIDGNFDNVKGTGKTLIRWTATVTTTAVETEIAMLKTALGVVDVAGTKLTARHTIKESDYQDLYVIAEKSNGELIQVTLKNSMNTSGLSLATANNGQGGISLTISANYDVKKPNEVPFEIETLVPVVGE